MADVEKIAAELRAGLGGGTRGPFIVVPPSSRGEPADIYMSRDKNGIYEGWIGEMALTADAEHFAACSPANIRALLDELSRLREAERRAKDALEPFARAAGYLTDANGWCDTDEIELCYDDGRRLSTIPLSAFRAAARALSTQVEERE